MSKRAYFVYGTLKKGHGNNRLIVNQEYAGTATLNGYRMHHLGGFPAVTPDENRVVQGEVWMIDEETEPKVDRLEGYSNGYKGFYDKALVEVTNENDQTIKAYVYFMPDDSRSIQRSPVIEEGVW